MDPVPSITLPLHDEASPAASDPPSADDQGSQHLAWLLAATQPETARRYDYLLLLRFTLVNVLAFGLLGAAIFIHRYSQGHFKFLTTGFAETAGLSL